MISCFKKCADCCKKLGRCFTKVINGRTIDAFYRGISRGMSANTLVKLLGRIFYFNAQPAAAIISIPVSAVTAYTSYAGTQWWTDSHEKIMRLLSQPKTRGQTCRKVVDASCRGAARADAISNCILLIGTFIGLDLTIPAGVLALVTLAVASWSSYRRTYKRHQYAANFYTAITPGVSDTPPASVQIRIDNHSGDAGDEPEEPSDETPIISRIPASTPT